MPKNMMGKIASDEVLEQVTEINMHRAPLRGFFKCKGIKIFA